MPGLAGRDYRHRRMVGGGELARWEGGWKFPMWCGKKPWPLFVKWMIRHSENSRSAHGFRKPSSELSSPRRTIEASRAAKASGECGLLSTKNSSGRQRQNFKVGMASANDSCRYDF